MRRIFAEKAKNVHTQSKEANMSEFEFSVIASGLDPSDDETIDRFFKAGCDDATVAFARGVFILSFVREAASLQEAIDSAVANVCEAGAEVGRVEPDCLVSLSDIAERAGLTRAAASLYSQGKRGSGFPKPVARVTTNSPLYDWPEVASWLSKHAGLDAVKVDEAVVIKSINDRIEHAAD